MLIELNADKNLNIHELFGNKLNGLLTTELRKYSDRISRLDVHFSDENGAKGGPNDKRCMIEVRIAGMHPHAVTEYADTYELAINGAIDKLQATLATVLGKARNHEEHGSDVGAS